eukprot:20092_3
MFSDGGWSKRHQNHSPQIWQSLCRHRLETQGWHSCSPSPNPTILYTSRTSTLHYHILRTCILISDSWHIAYTPSATDLRYCNPFSKMFLNRGYAYHFGQWLQTMSDLQTYTSYCRLWKYNNP